uniref:Uncharacterized protein n=1 Tax=Glossina palpalis gambiensis TaxID=67801 RepID=A0A1B0C2D4_9MUSC
MLPFVDAFKNLPFLPSIFGKVLTVANDIHNDDCDHDDDNDDDENENEDEDEDEDNNGVIGDVMNGMLFLTDGSSSSSSSSSSSGSSSCSPITDNNSSSNANI